MDCGNKAINPRATVTRDRERERERERQCFYVLVAALPTQDPKPSTDEQKACEQERKMTAQRSPKEAREIISGCEKHVKSKIGSNEQGNACCACRYDPICVALY